MATDRDVRDFEGETGNSNHITRKVYGHVSVDAVRNLRGVKGEVPGEHRNMSGDRWESFKSDVRDRGVQQPIFITHDYGEEPKISEGNHRRDAAVAAGHSTIPAEINYYGHAEQHDQLFRDRRE